MVSKSKRKEKVFNKKNNIGNNSKFKNLSMTSFIILL